MKDGKYLAVVYFYEDMDGSSMKSDTVGTYDTEGEANRAARKAARKLNKAIPGFVDTDCPDGRLCVSAAEGGGPALQGSTPLLLP